MNRLQILHNRFCWSSAEWLIRHERYIPDRFYSWWVLYSPFAIFDMSPLTEADEAAIARLVYAIENSDFDISKVEQINRDEWLNPITD
jgi:hypothetical protein